MEPYEDTTTTFTSIKTELIAETIKNTNRAIKYMELLASYHVRDSMVKTKKDRDVADGIKLEIRDLKETIKKLKQYI